MKTVIENVCSFIYHVFKPGRFVKLMGRN